MKSTLIALLVMLWAPSASAVSILYSPTTPSASFFFKVFAMTSSTASKGPAPRLELFAQGGAATEDEALVQAMLSGVDALMSWWPTYGGSHDDLKVAWTWVLPSGTFQTPGEGALGVLGYAPGKTRAASRSSVQTGLVSLALSSRRGGPVFGFVGEFGPVPRIATVSAPSAGPLALTAICVLGLVAMLRRGRRRKAESAAALTPPARAVLHTASHLRPRPGPAVLAP